MFGVNKSSLALMLVLVGLAGQYAQAQDLCDDPKFDTIFSTPSGVVYILKGNEYSELTSAGDGNGYSIASGYPLPIQQHWRELPGNVGASFTDYKAGMTYFFKGSQVWKYSGTTLQSGFPKQISEEFPGIPDDIDLAFMCSGGYYFFKGSKFWGFNLHHRAASGPYSITGFWRGLVDNMHAALQLPAGGYTYFFKGLQFYKLKTSTLSVEVASPPYPHDTERFWLDCDLPLPLPE